MLSHNTVRYGQDDPLPEQRLLRAGPLSVMYEAGDLRYVMLGERELVRRIYIAVRDHNWGTVPALLSNERIIASDDSFQITYDMRNQQDAIDFVWHAEISGASDGTLHFRMEGTAHTSFLRNRIGLCVLQPPALAGAACEIAHVNETREHGTLPRFIAPQVIQDGRIYPHEPFAEMQALTFAVTQDVAATLHFEGDIFELEDQRNWIDGSFKIYSTPLRLPFPAMIAAGTMMQQTITLTLDDQRRATTDQRPAIRDDPCIVIEVDSVPIGTLPAIGLSVASHKQPLSEQEIVRLQALRPSHLRVDLDLTDPDYQAALEEATGEARALDVPLEIALFMSDQAEAELGRLRTLLAAVAPSVAAWLIFHRDEAVTASGWLTLARTQLADYAPQAVFATGTNVYFTDINRAHPATDTADALTYSINPQVHAFDNLSLVETAATIGTTISSAQQFSGGVPIMISPVTLKPRFNAVATGPASTPDPDRLPSQVDPRQMSLFGACWTMASLKYSAESGARSATYYETTGWRGVMETVTGSPLPERFASLPGTVFPLYHVLADVNAYAGGMVIRTHSRAPLLVESLALRIGDRTRILLANMTNTPQQVRIPLGAIHARVRTLDERTAAMAMPDPAQFRADAGTLIKSVDGKAKIDLLPYGIACIDT